MKCKCVADVAAIVSEYTDGLVKEFQVYIKLEQGQAIAKIRDSREGEIVGYVGLFDLASAETVAHRILDEVARARRELSAAHHSP